MPEKVLRFVICNIFLSILMAINFETWKYVLLKLSLFDTVNAWIVTHLFSRMYLAYEWIHAWKKGWPLKCLYSINNGYWIYSSENTHC